MRQFGNIEWLDLNVVSMSQMKYQIVTALTESWYQQLL
jgi:hypothetical protein